MIALPLGPGSRGEAVVDLQRRLSSLALLTDEADTIGHYGPATVQAVRSFQHRYGLKVDGTCNELTWSILVEAGYHLGDRQLYLRAPMMRGDDIADLQGRLGSLGFDAGRADGIFGPATAAAVADFQRNAGITSDGICGPDTFAALHRLGPERTGALMVTQVRERERLRRATPGLSGRRIILGHTGAPALIHALHRQLREAGASVLTLTHPDAPTQARMANAADGEVFLSIEVSADPANRIAYFKGVKFWSQPGHSLAQHIGDALHALLDHSPSVVGMRLPLLRETRMPAVIAEIGPAGLVVTRNEQLAGCFVAALVSWSSDPVTASAPSRS